MKSLFKTKNIGKLVLLGTILIGCQSNDEATDSSEGAPGVASPAPSKPNPGPAPAEPEFDCEFPALYFLDADGDSYGDPSNFTTACELPAGYAENADDCNDLVPFVHPDADEILDGVDNDCDAEIDEGLAVLAQPGDIVISEIMSNPEGLQDSEAEYVELANRTGSPIDLYGMKIMKRADFDPGSGSFHTFSSHVILEAMSVAVFVKNQNSTANGSISESLSQLFNITLNNSNTEIVLVSKDWEIIDQINYESQSGHSYQLDRQSIFGDGKKIYCQSDYIYSQYGDAENYGTPGAINTDCQ